jgi:hypothetical protein
MWVLTAFILHESWLTQLVLFMKSPKYFEIKNLPLRLSWREHPEFLIYKYEKEGSGYRLHYQLDDRGLSVYLDDKAKFDKFPFCFEVESGGWYGDKGRWTPIERYLGSIICENVSSFKKVSAHGENYKFKITHPFLSSTKTLLFESEKVGIIELKCKNFVPQKYDIFFLDKIQNQWVPRNYAIDNLDFYFDKFKWYLLVLL